MHIPLPLSVDARGKDLLRFITCGSVDDGKSTLIGRLLHDSKLIFEDQLASLVADSVQHGTTGADIDFALLVDGLEAEREQGITIDVAYRFFSTPERSFIVSDTPGHAQYTRNMATGASNAQLAVILIDARKGVLVQTRRHSLICSLLGIRHVILAVNKIDLVDYDKDKFDEIVVDYTAFAAELNFRSIVPIRSPLALVIMSLGGPTIRDGMEDPTLLHCLETADAAGETSGVPFRFPVQWVNRPTSEFRGYAGTVVSSRINTGDTVVVATTGQTTRIKETITYDGKRAHAGAGAAVTFTLTRRHRYRARRYKIHRQHARKFPDQFAAHIIWMSDEPLMPGRSYLARIATKTVPISITALKYKIVRAAQNSGWPFARIE